MIRNLEEHAVGSLPTYDVCIIGAGPAGIALARELGNAGLKLALLESGLTHTCARGDELRLVESEGIRIKDYSRERVLGGASTTWAGLSSMFDEIDFEQRDWVAHSGWPIAREDLLADYARASERYRFAPPDAFTDGGLAHLREKSVLQPEWNELDEKIFLAAAEPQNFARDQREFLAGELVDVWLDATLVRLESEADGAGAGATVETGVLKTSGGKEHRVRARVFVLGTGGIENARVLLQSEAPGGGTLGNEHDQVGRYLMNHPKNYAGILHLAQPVEELPYYFGCMYQGFAGYAGLRFSESRQRKRRLLNTYVRFEPLYPWSDSPGVEALVLFVKRSGLMLRRMRSKSQQEVVNLRDYSETGDDSDAQNERKTTASWIGLGLRVLLHLPSVTRYAWNRVVARKSYRVKRVRLRNFMEMEPHPDNRVLLGEERDSNGERRALVRHDTTELDRRTLTELHTALAREVEAQGIGRLVSDLDQADPWPIDQDASHHMGTTRMGDDPRKSVCDSDLRVHGVTNLYAAGASVLPTAGCANPTWTLVALSIRLARHLRGEFATGRFTS